MDVSAEQALERALCTWACLDGNRCACERAAEIVGALREAGFAVIPVSAIEPFRETLQIGPLNDDIAPARGIDPRCSFTIGDVRSLVAHLEAAW